MIEGKNCPKCNSNNVNKSGIFATVKKGKRQRFICRECGHTFY